jgi:hypothetical protein
LKNALNLSKLWVENRNDQEQFLIIPIGGEYKPLVYKNESHRSYLLLSVTPEGEITKGNIIQYIPTSSPINELPLNTFSKIFNYQKIDCDGRFAVFTPTGRFKYDLTFNKGKLCKVRETSRRNAENPAQRTTNDCWDFWLVTTTYYEDGTTGQDRYYLGQTCYRCGEIQPDGTSTACTELDDDANPEGSGGGSDNITYEYLVKREDINWKVANSPVPTVNGEIYSRETLKGKKVAGELDGGHFTEIIHRSSWCNFCSIEQPYNNWVENTSSTKGSLPTPQEAKSTVVGNLHYDGITFNISKSNTWSFGSVFP